VEYANEEKKRCVYCHTSLGKPDLNKAGEYYEKHKTLEGYKEDKTGKEKKPFEGPLYLLM